MAAAARPNPSDARVPCIQCGGLIHPIAGRCKHCKAELSSLRGARPAAAAALPALAKPSIDVPLAHRADPVTPPAAMAKVLADPAFIAASTISVLPPRPEHSAHLQVAHGERGWFGRNWPVVVIVLAAIAIIGAVVLMMLPPGAAAAAGKTTGAPGPASDRMETNPLLPQLGQQDNNGGAPQARPPSALMPDPQPDPLPDPRPDPLADPSAQGQRDPDAPLSDPFANPSGNGGFTGGDAVISMLGNIASRMCDRAKSCGDPTLGGMCASLQALPKMPLPANCPAAQKCIEIVDQVDVCNSGGPADFQSLALSTSACVEAMTKCT